jgi:hypothetical protein
MGKSKTIYRIAKERIVIPICLRVDDAVNTFCELAKLKFFVGFLTTSMQLTPARTRLFGIILKVLPVQPRVMSVKGI